MITRLIQTKTNKNEEGFTLLELMIVVVIIGILAAIAIPIFVNQQKGAHDAAVKTDLKNAATSFHTFQATKGQGRIPTTSASVVELVNLSDRSNYAPVVNYGLLCVNQASNYAIYLTSASGTTFVYSSSTGKITEDSGFPRTGASACPDAGVSSPNWMWTQDSNWFKH